MTRQNSSNSDPSAAEYTPNLALHSAANRLILAQRRSLLLVEDTAAHAILVERAMDPNLWSIEHTTRASDALLSFERDSERIVLLDLSLPDSDGLTLLGKLQSINADAAVIVVTATDQVSVSVEAMRKGAWDYVVKSDPAAWSKTISEAVERAYNRRLRLAEDNLIEQTRLVELVRAQRLEAIEVIVRTVCHEVNNPLSGVIALSQLLTQRKDSDADIQRLAQAISRSAHQVAEVVNKLKNVNDDEIVFGGKKIFSVQSPEEKNEPPKQG